MRIGEGDISICLEPLEKREWDFLTSHVSRQYNRHGVFGLGFHSGNSTVMM